MTYKEFLKTKEIESINSGIDVEDSELNPNLFPYQRDIVKFNLRKGRSATFSDCGTGKSIMQLDFARLVCKHTGGKALIIAPLSVVKQTQKEGLKFGIASTVVREQSEVRDGINITNYEILEHFDANEFNCVILDECFTPDTKIDCIDVRGGIVQKPISEIKVGDTVINCIGRDTVSATRKKKVDYAIRIGYNGKKIICSPRHPFFTKRGWVCAKDLQERDVLISTNTAMRILRERVQDNIQIGINKEILRQVLFSEMENAATGDSREGSCKRSARADRKEKVNLVTDYGGGAERNRENQKTKSNNESRNEGKNLEEIKGKEVRTFKAWGKWNGDDVAAAINDGCIARELDSGISYLTGKETARIPDVLQSRLGELGSEDCNRSRWELSQIEKRARQEEGRKTGLYGLESFEILERGCAELDQYRDADGQLYFYDLEIERHPSFSVNNCLVHNSSILKSFSSSTRNLLIDTFQNTPYKLCCSATPAPNDTSELANTIEFLGIMSRSELLSTYFIHDSGDTSKWRLKGYGEEKFWEFMATVAVCVRNPADLGYSAEGYKLPMLKLIKHVVHSKPKDYELVARRAETLSERREARKESMDDRVEVARQLADGSSDSWLIWCDYNAESTALRKSIANSVEIVGGDSPEVKANTALDFADGKIHVLISKPSIYGFGMNFQSCHNVIFCGISDSYESFYQAIRRCWRYGQNHTVNVHIIISEAELNVLENIERKQALMDEMQNRMVSLMRDVTMSEMKHTTRITTDYKPKERMDLPKWLLA